MEQPISPKKVIFYFDGFNFYHGFKAHTLIKDHWKNYYWLNFGKFCSQFVFEHDNQKLHKIKYFTAPPKNVQKRSKQNALFSANAILNGNVFEVINGHYSDKFIDCHATCKEQFKVPEEKCTDVNLALTMVNDCIEGNVDIITLITADSDQVSTIKYIQTKFPHIKIKVYFPPERKSNEIRYLIKTVVFLENHEDKFKNAKMPGIVSGEIDGKQKKYTRPEDWKK